MSCIPTFSPEALCENGDFAEALRTYETARAVGTAIPLSRPGSRPGSTGTRKIPGSRALLPSKPAGRQSYDPHTGCAHPFGRGRKRHRSHCDNKPPTRLSKAMPPTNIRWPNSSAAPITFWITGALLLNSDAMLGLPVYPPYARQWQCTASWAARLRRDDAPASAMARTAKIASAVAQRAYPGCGQTRRSPRGRPPEFVR